MPALSNEIRALSAVIQAQGGVVAVARAAGFAHTAVSRWLRGLDRTLSATSISHLWAVVGLRPGGGLVPGRVHFWRGRPTLHEQATALGFAMPAGAEMAVAPWSRFEWTLSNIRDRSKLRREVALFRPVGPSDTWLVLSIPAGRVPIPQALGPLIRWRGGHPGPAILHIDTRDAGWHGHTAPGPMQCRQAWGGEHGGAVSWEQVADTARAAGLSAADVLRLIEEASRPHR